MQTLMQVPIDGPPDARAQRASMIQQAASFAHCFQVTEGPTFQVSAILPEDPAERLAFLEASLEAVLHSVEETLDPAHRAILGAILRQRV